MKQEKRNIEDFLKDKLDGFDAGYQNDWSQFETKLDRAILYYRMKVGALIGVVLLLITLGIAGGDSLMDLTGPDTRAAASPAFMNSLRQRAPFITNNLRNSSTSASKVQSSELATEDSQNGETILASETEIIPVENITHAGAHSDNASLLVLTAKIPVTDLIVNEQPGKLRLQNNHINNAALPSVANISPQAVLLLAEDSENPSEDFERFREEPVSVNSELVLDPQLVYTDGNSDGETDLEVRPVIMPVKFKKSPAYISPLQASSPWSYSVYVYPNFTFRKFKVDREKLNLIHRDFIDATQEAESGGFSLNVGFTVSRRIGRITYLNGGVEYINYKTVAEYDFYNYRQANMDPLTDQILNYSLLSEPEHISFSGNNIYHYLNFPLSISHQPWATDHVRLNIEAGGSFMYFLGANGQAIDYQSLEIIDIADREYNNSIASLHMKVGVSYYVSERFNFGLEPTLMYFTNTIYSEDYPFQVIPYSVGVNFKLQVKLN